MYLHAGRDEELLPIHQTHSVHIIACIYLYTYLYIPLAEHKQFLFYDGTDVVYAPNIIIIYACIFVEFLLH